MTFDWQYFIGTAGAVACFINAHEKYWHSLPSKHQALAATAWLTAGLFLLGSQAMHFPAH